MNFAYHSAVPLREGQDDGGRRQAADLEHDEHEVAAMDRKRADEQAADTHIAHARRLTPAKQCSFPRCTTCGT